jgi:hypothetical protein
MRKIVYNNLRYKPTWSSFKSMIQKLEVKKKYWNDKIPYTKIQDAVQKQAGLILQALRGKFPYVLPPGEDPVIEARELLISGFNFKYHDKQHTFYPYQPILEHYDNESKYLKAVHTANENRPPQWTLEQMDEFNKALIEAGFSAIFNNRHKFFAKVDKEFSTQFFIQTLYNINQGDATTAGITLSGPHKWCEMAHLLYTIDVDEKYISWEAIQTYNKIILKFEKLVCCKETSCPFKVELHYMDLCAIYWNNASAGFKRTNLYPKTLNKLFDYIEYYDDRKHQLSQEYKLPVNVNIVKMGFDTLKEYPTYSRHEGCHMRELLANVTYMRVTNDEINNMGSIRKMSLRNEINIKLLCIPCIDCIRESYQEAYPEKNDLGKDLWNLIWDYLIK